MGGDMNRQFGFLIVATVLYSLPACVAMDARKVDWRSDPQKPTSETALLKCWPDLRILSIDGDKTKALSVGGGLWFRACDILIDSGPHTVIVQYASSFSTGTMTVSRTTGEIPVSFTAEPSGVYQLKYQQEKTGAFSSDIRPYVEPVKQ
jgi:hypothetical protein